ncbi:MAG: NAD(P)H-dependent oxidoreductase subunit E, partial [Paracoccaceae bacterium]
VGSVAHVQVCGTLSCMICGAEDLIGVCKEKIADKAHEVSADGKFSWEEVECLGSCSNAPMVQIGKDYYEDLTSEKFAWILDELAAGRVPTPGPQNGRYAAEPLGGLTSLGEFDSGKTKYNASAQLASDIGDTVKRIDGTEVPLITPWVKSEKVAAKAAAPKAKAGAKPKAAPKSGEKATVAAKKPRTMKSPRKAGADDLKMIKGVGPKLEKLLNTLGFYHFDQIAKWSAKELSWADDNIEGFKGRASRDNWVEQARKLVSGQETEFSIRVFDGDV